MKRPHAARSIMLEWYLSAVLMIWSALLLLPSDYFEHVLSFAALTTMSATTNWGLAGVITALFQVAALRANWYVYGREARFVSALCGVGYWSLLFYTSFLIPQANVAWVWYGSYALAWVVCGISQIWSWLDPVDVQQTMWSDDLLVRMHDESLRDQDKRSGN